MNSIVETEHLKKHLGSLEVLNGIDSCCNKDGVTTIIGSSGSSKPTLLRHINLLETPDTREILYHDKDILKGEININEHRMHVGMVFQSFSLSNNKSMPENCMLGRIEVLKRGKANTEEKVMLLLKEAGTKSLTDASVVQLSDGQKQRMAIVHVLCMESGVLPFDEPMSALNPGVVGDVLDVMKDLAREDLTMIVVTYEMQFAYDISPRVVFMDKGVTAEEGAPRQLFKYSGQEHTKGFLKRCRISSQS